VPGISSAIAGPAAAGVPVTHRGVATHFTVVTGYTATADADQMATTWQHLAAAGGTLVVLMGLTRLDALVDSLLRAGIPADRPACVVHAATTAHEQVLDATLATLPHVVAAAGFRNHTLLVIGDVVALRQPGFAESLAWLPN
jgi:siroheme synthase